MDLDLTKRQQEIFDFIKRYSSSHGYPPTVRDISNTTLRCRRLDSSYCSTHS